MFEQYSKHPDNNFAMQDVYKNAASCTSGLVLVSNPVQDSWLEWRQIFLTWPYIFWPLSCDLVRILYTEINLKIKFASYCLSEEYSCLILIKSKFNGFQCIEISFYI